MQTMNHFDIDRAELRAACDAARARVAADPNSEEAAEDLFRAVSRAAAEFGIEPPVNMRPVAIEITQAARLLESGEEEKAELILRRYLSIVRNDPAAMLLMADIAAKNDFLDNAEKILRRSVEIDSRRTENWVALAKLLHQRAQSLDRDGLVEESLGALEKALAADPTDESALAYKAAMLLQLRRLDEGNAAYENLLREHPESSAGWTNYAYLLKTLGRFGDAVAAARTAFALDPSNGPAWWGFADLKLAQFFQSDIDRMEEMLTKSREELPKINLHFALASAYQQAKQYEKAADHLAKGNAARLSWRPYEGDVVVRGIDEAIKIYTPAFFSARAGAGDPSSSPIFVVSMPRSGSTLVEQILSSHSAIEGTEELVAIHQIEGELARKYGTGEIEKIIPELLPKEFAQLGRRYLELTQFHRRTNRPRFTDKNPGNWRETGLIHAMLPNAKIIDVRRNPLDNCFANYAQHYLFGVNYSYGQREVAAHYRQYVRLMRHFDEVIPGVVHRIIYEDLVDNFEAEVRRLFDYLELPFEESCLRFFETDRAVHTPSSGQVRQPINRSGIGKWRNFEPWLGEMKDALAETIEDWR